MEDLNIGVEDNGGEKTLRNLASALTELKRAFDNFASTPVGQLAKAFEQLGSSSARMATEVNKNLGNVQTAAKNAGSSAGRRFDLAFEQSLTSSISPAAAGKVKERLRALQGFYEAELGSMVAQGKRMSIPVVIDYKVAGVQLDPSDRLRLRMNDTLTKTFKNLQRSLDTTEGLRAKSAGKFTEDDFRALIGAPSRDGMKSFAASLKAQMQEGLKVEGLRAKSAGKVAIDDFRNLVGLPSNKEMTEFSSQLKRDMEQSARAAAASARSMVIQATKRADGGYSRLSDRAPMAPFKDVSTSADRSTQAIDRFRGAAAAASGDLRDLHSAARGVASGFDAMWLTWGNVAPLLAGAALSGAFVQSIKKGAEFENTLAAIEALAGESSGAVKLLGDEALRVGSQGSVHGPLALADAFKVLALAGLSATEQLQAMGAVRNFAIVGETDLSASAQGLVAISTAYGYAAKNYSVVADVVAATAASSMASISDMTEAFKQASVVAQQYGVTLEDTSTTLALLSQIGITGSAAGTAMRNMYTELMGSSKKARKVLEQTLKIDVWDEAAKAMKPLPVIMEDMAEALAKMDTKSQQRALADLGNERGTKALSANLSALEKKLKDTGEASTTAFEKIREEISKAPGYAATAAAVMGGTTLNQIKSVGAALESALVGSFKRSEPAVQSLALQLRELFGSQEFQSSISALAGAVAGLAETLVRNADILMTLAKMYVTYKAAVLAAELATLGLARATVIAGAVSSTWSAVTQVVRGAALTFQAGTLSSTALAASVGLVGPAASGAAVGVRALTVALGPIAAVLAAAGVAWALFASEGDAAAGKGSKSLDVMQTGYDSLLSSIDQEITRLDEVAKARENNLAGAAAAAAVERGLAERKIREIIQAKASLLDLEEQERRTAAASWEKWRVVPGMGAIVDDAQIGLANSLKDIEARRLDLVVEEGLALSKVSELQRKANENAKAAAKDARDAMRNRRSGTDTYNPDDGAGGQGSPERLSKDNTIQELEKLFAIKMRLVEGAATRSKTVLDDARNAEAISEGQYRARELTETLSAQNTELATIQEYTEKIKSAYADRGAAIYALRARIDAGPGTALQKERRKKELDTEKANLDNTYETFLAELEGRQGKLENSTFVRIQRQASLAAGEIRKLLEGKRQLDRSESNRATDRTDSVNFEVQTSGLPDDKVAILRAEFEERRRIADMVRGQTQGIEDLQRATDEFAAQAAKDWAAAPKLTVEDALSQYSPEHTKQLEAYNAQLALAKRLRDELAAGAAGKSNAAGVDEATVQLERMSQIDLASVFDNAAVSINGMKVNLGALANQMVAVASHEETYAKLKADAQKQGKSTADLERKIAASRLNDGASMISMVKGYAKEGTKTYKALQAAEQVYHAAQLAMGLATFVEKMGWLTAETTATVASEGVKAGAEASGTATSLAMTATRTAAKATEAVVAQLTLPFPANVPAVAMVVGMLAALGVATGAVGGSKGSFGPTNEGKGTTLGDSAKASESIPNSIKLLDSLNTLSGVTLEYTRQMATSLHNMESQMGGVAALMSRNGVAGLAGANVQTGLKLNSVGKLMSLGGGTGGAVVGSLIGSVIAGPLGMTAGAIIGKALSKGFGTSTKIKGQGVMADDQNLGAVLSDGLSLDSYADVRKKKKAFGITYKTNDSVVRAKADSETSNQFTGIIRNLAQTVATAAGPIFGSMEGAMDRLKDYTVSIGKIKLDGLTGDQVQERLNAVFSAEGDKMTKFIASGIEDMQLTGEGMYETLVRVSSTLVTVNDSFETLGYAIRATGVEGAHWAVALADAFGGMDKFQTAMGKYYQAFYTEEERTTATRQRLTKELTALGVKAIPTTVEGYRKMVDQFVAGNDMTSEAAQATYAQLIQLSEPFESVTKAVDAMKEEMISSSKDILDYVNKLKGDRADLATPTQKLEAARTKYVTDLTKAKTGDADAMKSVTSSADDYIQAQKDVTASSSYTQAVIDQIIAELTNLSNNTKTGVPAFANGGYHAGGWAMVGEEGPELAYFDSPARIYTAKQTAAMGDNSELVSEVRALRQEVSSLRAQQSQETQVLVNSNVAAQQKAAGMVVDGVMEATERHSWTQNNQPVIK